MIISVVFLLALVGPSVTYAVGLEFAVGGWKQSPQGDLSFNEIGDVDILDLEDDLNYDDETRIFGRLKIDLPLPIPNIYLMATPMEFDGTGQKNVDFNFGDITFAGSVDFLSELTLDHLDLALYYGLPFIETATADMLNIEVGINVRIYDFEGTIEGEDIFGVTIKESESYTLPIPMIYLAAQLRPLERLAIEGEGRGVIFGDDKIYSLIGRLKLKVFGPLFIAGGYRWDRIDIDEKDVALEMDFSGPFVEGGFAF
ncbi:MAG: TIGR04219 family outer membrane beta-barrel protein [Deltaproteobacteria bacterium]|nr:MAG: TIGR04219 family outer membrane beta-barrel protein [Deltaproteobacteria bacterium]